MKPWRWFVGQVARLRRTIVDAVAPGRPRRGRSDGHEPRAGPPEHWVERVRQGAPGLLEPSFRERNGSQEQPVAERVMPPATEPTPPPEPLEQIARDEATPEPSAARRKATPVRLSRLRRTLRREPPRTVPPAEAASAPLPDELPGEPAPYVSRNADFPPAPPPERLRQRDEREAERAGRRQRTAEVGELDAPLQSRAPRSERAASPKQRLEAGLAPASEESMRRPEPEVRTKGVRERAVPMPAPKRESDGTRAVEPAVRRPVPQREASVEPSAIPSRPEPLTEVAVHPWPELPPPLDHDDSDVEAALRAWEHQQRLDREQTRL